MTELNAQEHDERPSWTGRAVLTGIGFFVAACLVAWLRIEQYSQAMAIIGSALYPLLMWFSAGSGLVGSEMCIRDRSSPTSSFFFRSSESSAWR